MAEQTGKTSGAAGGAASAGGSVTAGAKAPAPARGAGQPGPAKGAAPEVQKKPGAPSTEVSESRASGAESGAAPEASATAPAPPPPQKLARLPGVMPDAGADEQLGEARYDDSGLENAIRRAGESAPATGAGEQDSEQGAAEAAGAEGSPAAEAAPAAPPPAPAPKFKIGDYETPWKDEEQAKHAIKTVLGMHESVARRERELASQQNAVIQALAQVGLQLDRDGQVVPRGPNGSAYGAGVGSATQPLGAQHGAQQQASFPSAETPGEGDAESGLKSILDNALNWKLLPGIVRAYEEQHGETMGAAVAIRMVLESVLPKLMEHVRGEYQREIEPFRNVVGSLQASTAVTNLFSGMRGYTFHDGTPAYPELHDEAGQRAIYGVWKDLGNTGLPPQLLMSPQGIQIAVSLYRDFQRMQGRGQQQQSSPQPNSSAPGSVPVQQTQGSASPTDAATAAVRAVMQSIESARGAVSGTLEGEGAPLRPASSQYDERTQRIHRAIREARGKDVIPGVSYS